MFKILVVEDDRELNHAVCSFLSHNDYEAVGCLTADDAYDAMYSTTFDLIISDVMMPDVDGFEFARTVRGLDQEIPILFMTARDDFAAKQQGFRIGIDDYMVKPGSVQFAEFVKITAQQQTVRLPTIMRDPTARRNKTPEL